MDHLGNKIRKMFRKEPRMSQGPVIKKASLEVSVSLYMCLIESRLLFQLLPSDPT